MLPYLETEKKKEKKERRKYSCIFSASLWPTSLHWTDVLGGCPLLSPLHQRMPSRSNELSLWCVRHMALLSCGAHPIEPGCAEFIFQPSPWGSWRSREHERPGVSAYRTTDLLVLETGTAPLVFVLYCTKPEVKRKRQLDRGPISEAFPRWGQEFTFAKAATGLWLFEMSRGEVCI